MQFLGRSKLKQVHWNKKDKVKLWPQFDLCPFNEWRRLKAAVRNLCRFWCHLWTRFRFHPCFSFSTWHGFVLFFQTKIFWGAGWLGSSLVWLPALVVHCVSSLILSTTHISCFPSAVLSIKAKMAQKITQKKGWFINIYIYIFLQSVTVKMLW